MAVYNTSGNWRLYLHHLYMYLDFNQHPDAPLAGLHEEIQFYCRGMQGQSSLVFIPFCIEILIQPRPPEKACLDLLGTGSAKSTSTSTDLVLHSMPEMDPLYREAQFRGRWRLRDSLRDIHRSSYHTAEPDRMRLYVLPSQLFTNVVVWIIINVCGREP